MSTQHMIEAYELALQLITEHGWKMSLEEISDIAEHGLDGDLDWLRTVNA